MAQITLLWQVIDICKNITPENLHTPEEDVLHQWYRQDYILLCDRCNRVVEQECPFMAVVREIPPMHSELITYGPGHDFSTRTVLRNAFLKRHF